MPCSRVVSCTTASGPVHRRGLAQPGRESGCGEYFRSVIASGSAETDTARLSAAVVLSQILLLEGKHDEYAELCTETLAPLLLKLHRSLPVQSSSDTLDLTSPVA